LFTSVSDVMFIFN